MRRALANIFLLTLEGILPFFCGILPVLLYFRLREESGIDRWIFWLMLGVQLPFILVGSIKLAISSPETAEKRIKEGARWRKWMLIVAGPAFLAIGCFDYGPPVYDAVKYAAQPKRSVAEQRAAHPDELVQVPGLAAGSMPLMLSYIPSASFVTGTWLERRVVILTQGFYMGKYEITNAQFEAFAKDTGYVTNAEKEGNAYGWDANKKSRERIAGMCWRNAGFPWPLTGNLMDHPVVLVSWDDAKAFCAWLGAKVGGTWDLPTDAQWEYACRAGTRTAFYWGDSLDDACTYENVATPEMRRSLTAMDRCPRETTPFPCEDGFYATAPVGQFAPNIFGLYDMLGNVSELCGDKYTSSYSPPLFLAVDPEGFQGRRDSGLRVVRGGCWESDPKYCRADYSSDLSNDGAGDGTGFRVIRVK